jgi:hypothetical protein
LGSTGVAIFWDFDNVRSSPDQICFYADVILSYANNLGILKYQGGSAVWNTVSPFIQEVLVAHGFILVQNPSVEPNAADNALAEQLLGIFKQKNVKISDFVLITNDRGFLYHMGVIHAQGAKVHLITSQNIKSQEFLNRAAVQWNIDELLDKHLGNKNKVCYGTNEWKQKQKQRRSEIFSIWQESIGEQIPNIINEIRKTVLNRLKNPPPKPKTLSEEQLSILGLDKWKHVHQSSLMQEETAEFLSSELNLSQELIEDIIKDIIDSMEKPKKESNDQKKEYLCTKCNKFFEKKTDLDLHNAATHQATLNDKES